MDHLSLEKLFSNHRKSFHYSGEIGRLELEKNLTRSELLILVQVSTVLKRLAEMLAVNMCLFIVGSAADLSVTHGDVDAVCCVEQKDERVEFVQVAYGVLLACPELKVKRQERGSLMFGKSKLFILDHDLNTLDLTFVGPGGWTEQEMRTFHSQYNLAYCEYI